MIRLRGLGCGEGGEAVGDARGGVGVGLGAGGGGHGGEAIRGVEQAGERGEQFAGDFKIRLEEHFGGPCLNHGLGIAALMVVSGGGKGHEQGGLAGGSQFRYGRCATARHDQVGGGEACGHVVEVGTNLPAIGICTASCVGRLSLFCLTHSALM